MQSVKSCNEDSFAVVGFAIPELWLLVWRGEVKLAVIVLRKYNSSCKSCVYYR